MSQSTSTVPPEVLATWEKAADELIKKIEGDVVLLTALKKRLAAVEIFGNEYKFRAFSSVEDMSPADAILYYLEEIAKPVSKSQLRERLYRAGYPMERFGEACRYFYTLLRRLQRKDKIIVEDDEVSLMPARRMGV